MPQYSSLTIIFNPNSSGSGRVMAREFCRNLRKEILGLKVSVIGTKHAGHGEELAYDIARSEKRPLIISASGDGGYHDVINGLMRAQASGATPTAGILPAGNANDHYHYVHGNSFDIAKSIRAGRTQKIDLLKLHSVSDGHAFVRYAHSYIGLGLTSKASHELNKAKLNRLNEIWIVMRALLSLKPVRLRIGNTERVYDSLIFSNIGRMSKVVSLSGEARVDDGKFEVVSIDRRSRLELMASLLKASTIGLNVREQKRRFSFSPVRSCLVQLDGETVRLDAGAYSRVELVPRVLRCIA